MSTRSLEPVDHLRDVIRSEVGRPGVLDLVGHYFDPNWGFAGLLFDGAGPVLRDNPPKRFTADDLLAATLLDVSMSAKATQALLGDQRLNHQLEMVCTAAKLWDEPNEAIQRAEGLWESLCELEGIGPVIAGKLLARKRPHLIPIVDSVILRALPFAGHAWRNLGLALADDDTRKSIEAIRGIVPRSISMLRLLDVSIWMLHSGGKRAIAARDAAGIAVV